MGRSREVAWHVQSYFLVFRRRTLDSRAFAEFWSSVLLYRSKFQVIRSDEVGLSAYLLENGLDGRAFASCDKLPRRRSTPEVFNPTVLKPTELLTAGMPFIKTALLRDNPRKVRLGPVFEAIDKAGYDRSLLELDGGVTS